MAETDNASGALLVEQRVDAVAVLRLNDPARLNALSPEMKTQLESSQQRLRDDETIRAIVLTGTGSAFCAGGDIKAMSARKPTVVRASLHRTYHWLLPLLLCEKPIVTALNGAAVGAGFALALAGDIIVADEQAGFRPGFPAIGAVPDLALAYMLPRAIGLARAKSVLLRNQRISAEEAVGLGLVSATVPAAGLMDEALSIAHELAKAPLSVGLTKTLLLRGGEMSLEGFMELEALAQSAAFGSDDFDEGVSAFLAKRPARFTGR